MNNKVKILTAVVGVIAVGLGVTLMQPKTSDLQEPIVPVIVEVEETHEVEEVAVETAVETEEVEPTTEEIGEADTIELITEPEPVVEVVQVQATESIPVAVAEPEPTPVVVAEPEPTPVVVVEPEPTPVAVAEPVAIAEPDPIPVAETYTGQTYTTVYNGVSYTVTQEQYDRATSGRGITSVDGIPTLVFSQIKNAGVTSGGENLTTEEFLAQKNDTSLISDTVVTWS